MTNITKSSSQGLRLSADGLRREFLAERLGLWALTALAFSGYFKGHPIFSSFPVDITLLLAITTLALLAIHALTHPFPLSLPLSAGVAILTTWIAFYGGVRLQLTQYGQEKVTELFTVTILCIVSGAAFTRSIEGVKTWLNVAVAAGLLAVLLTVVTPDVEYATLFGRYQFEGASPPAAGRLLGGAATVCVISALLREPLFRFTSRGFAPAALASIPLIAALLALGARGPFFSFMAAVFLALALSSSRSTSRVYRFAAALAAVTAITSAVFLGESQALQRLGGAFAGAEADPIRSGLYVAAIRSALTNPFGIGWGGFLGESLSAGVGAYTYPHNLFLEVLVESGWLAFIAVLYLIVLAVYRLVPYTVTPGGTALLGLVLFWILAAQTTSDVVGNRATWAFLGAALSWATFSDHSASSVRKNGGTRAA